LLSSTINSTDTTIILSDVTGLPAAGFIRLDSEIISYGYIIQAQGSTQGTLYNCGRGQQDTFPAAHTAGAEVYWPQAPAVTVWPTPDQGTAASPYYQLAYWRMRRIQDAGAGVETADMNFRFLPAVTAGLAYHLALKIPGSMDRLPILKQQYDEAWELASTEDREKAAVRFVPRAARIGNGGY
jgi:hypothetical protein